MEWEQEQLRRGGHREPESASAKFQKFYKPALSQSQLKHSNGCTNRYIVPPLTSLPVLAPALTHLSDKMTKITMSHANNTVALNSIVLERDSVDKREREMRNMIGIAEEKRAWFDDFKQWVEGVANFLDEKVNFEPLPLHLVLTCCLVPKTREA